MVEKTEEAYSTRTKAYKFLKELLELPEGATINKDFFTLFFRESGGCFYLKKSKNFVEKLFVVSNIPKLNKEYYENKRSGKLKKAGRIKKEVMEIISVAIELAA